MRQIIEHKNAGRTYLLVEVPTMSYDFLVDNITFDNATMLEWDEGGMTNLCELPWGEYRILGLASDVSEETTQELVEGEYGWWAMPKFKDYLTTSMDLTPIESLISLCRSHSLHPSTTLILKNSTHDTE